MTKEALTLALEALENYDGQTWEQTKEAITAIKEALAQPEQEPLAFPVTLPWDNDPEKHPQFYTWTWDEFVSGGKWRAEYGWKKPTGKVTNLQALYTTPPQPSAIARKPLTDEQIFEINNGLATWMFPVETRVTDRELAFARAIEAAHGIKE